jgi:hypothetical protein
VGSSPRQAQIYDTASGQLLATLDEAAAAAAAAGVGAGGAAANGGGGGGGGGELVRGAASACFSPSGACVATALLVGCCARLVCVLACAEQQQP